MSMHLEMRASGSEKCWQGASNEKILGQLERTVEAQRTAQEAIFYSSRRGWTRCHRMMFAGL